MWLDRERTIEEVARFPPADAAATAACSTSTTRSSPSSAGRSSPRSASARRWTRCSAEHPRGMIWARRRQLSAVEVVRHEFTSRHIQAFLLWMAFQVFQPVDVPGSGVLPYQQTFGRQQRSWSIPIGGSGRLTAALTGYLADHGGTVLCGRRVTRLLLDGRALRRGGDRRRRAVPGWAPPWCPPSTPMHLRDMAPPRPGRRSSTTASTPTTWACPGSPPTTAPPPPPRSPRPTARAARCRPGLVSWPEDMIRMGADLRAGRFLADPAWVLVATPTLADPGRAPAGQHTVKVLTPQTYRLPGMGDWDTVKGAARAAPAAGRCAGTRRTSPTRSSWAS